MKVTYLFVDLLFAGRTRISSKLPPLFINEEFSLSHRKKGKQNQLINGRANRTLKHVYNKERHTLTIEHVHVYPNLMYAVHIHCL